ncbi:hypothetical protein L7F22_031175 [Adiantum nelumboides]|nr:hypothetical protein [Adiantum nelumboides]
MLLVVEKFLKISCGMVLMIVTGVSLLSERGIIVIYNIHLVAMIGTKEESFMLHQRSKLEKLQLDVIDYFHVAVPISFIRKVGSVRAENIQPIGFQYAKVFFKEDSRHREEHSNTIEKELGFVGLQLGETFIARSLAVELGNSIASTSNSVTLSSSVKSMNLAEEVAAVATSSPANESDVEAEKPAFVCGICLGKASGPDEARVTECGHFFCGECLRTWCTLSRKDVCCPSCRRPLPALSSNRISIPWFRLASCSTSCCKCGRPEAHLPVVLAGCGHVYCWPCIEPLLPKPCPALQRLILCSTVTCRNRQLGLPLRLPGSRRVSVCCGKTSCSSSSCITEYDDQDIRPLASLRLWAMLSCCTMAEQLDYIRFSLPLQYLTFLEGQKYDNTAESPAVRLLQRVIQKHRASADILQQQNVAIKSEEAAALEGMQVPRVRPKKKARTVASACSSEGKSHYVSPLLDVENMIAFCPQCSQPFNHLYVFPIFSAMPEDSAEPELDLQVIPPRVLPGSSIFQLLSFLTDISHYSELSLCS